MPNGPEHTKACLVVAALIGVPLLVGIPDCCGGWCALLVGIVFGDLLLSPDLDHRVGSQAYRLWGILRIIWIPYQRLTHHRCFWSHFPVVGTIGRIAYLAAVPVAVIAATNSWHILNPIKANISLALHVVAGVEIAAMTHYLLDWRS